MEFRFGLSEEVLVAEEWGTPIASITKREYAVMAGVLRSFDSDMYSVLLPNVEIGESTKRLVIAGLVNSGNRTGYDMSGKAVKLLFSPFAVNDVPMILLYNAIPQVDDAAKLSLQIGDEYGLAFMFLAAPDSRGWTYRVGNRDDLASKL